MTKRLNSLEALRNEIHFECKEIFQEAYKIAADRAFLRIEEYSGDRLLPVEKKMIIFQMIVTDMQEYDYKKYLKDDFGYGFLERGSLGLFSGKGFITLIFLIQILLETLLAQLKPENAITLAISLVIPLVNLALVYFGAGLLAKRTIERGFVKEIDDMMVRVNTNWNIFTAVLNKRDAQPENEDKVKVLKGNYGMTGVLEFFSSLVNTPYELNSTGFQLQGLDLKRR